MGRDEPDLDYRAAQDPAVFIKIFDHFLPRIYKYIRYRIGSQDEAEDLTSRVFELALANIGRYNPDRAPFRSWIFTIAHNTLTDYLRRRGRQREVSYDLLGEMACTTEGPANELIKKETREELLQAVARLSDRERDIIGLKFAAGLTNHAISEMTGLTESNVAVIIYRALKRMRADLSALEVNIG
ncbi:MAG: RNA polymerase sigma factor [Bacillota bacterium]